MHTHTYTCTFPWTCALEHAPMHTHTGSVWVTTLPSLSQARVRPSWQQSFGGNLERGSGCSAPPLCVTLAKPPTLDFTSARPRTKELDPTAPPAVCGSNTPGVAAAAHLDLQEVSGEEHLSSQEAVRRQSEVCGSANGLWEQNLGGSRKEGRSLPLYPVAHIWRRPHSYPLSCFGGRVPGQSHGGARTPLREPPVPAALLVIQLCFSWP